jgi:23S rRNA-/tRNA-specific pseudouridylate synthase
MESDENLRNIVHNYVMEVVDNDDEDVVEEDDDAVIITKEDGNIVHLSFGSRTKGSA